MALRDRLTSIRNIAEDALERVETRWDQAMDVLHGRPVRDPYLEDPRQLPQPPGQLPPPPQGIRAEHFADLIDSRLNESGLSPAGQQEALGVMDQSAARTEHSDHLTREPTIQSIAEKWSNLGVSLEKASDIADISIGHVFNQERLADDYEPDLDPIRMVYEGGWLVPEPGVEVQILLGKSDEGYHYGVETSVRGEDPGDPGWSKPYETRSSALAAGNQRLHEIHYPDIDDLESHTVTEVRARDWWEDQRALILETQAEHDDPFGRRSESIQQQIEALGPEPSNDAKVWLNGQGRRVEQPSVELQPIEIERPAIEERADRDEHALGLEREDERSQERDGLEL